MTVLRRQQRDAIQILVIDHTVRPVNSAVWETAAIQI